MEQLPPPHPKTVEEYFRYHQSRCIVVVAETGFTYFGVFVLFIIQTVTGLAMFCVSTNNVMEPFFTWVLLKCGGFFVVRQIHHIAMWAFILFTIAHIYLVFYHDYIERNGIASSIIGGWKFVREDLAEEYETEQKQQQQLQKQKDGIANETTEK